MLDCGHALKTSVTQWCVWIISCHIKVFMFLTRLHIGSWRGWIWGYRQDTCQASDHSSRLCFNICTLGIAGNSHCLGTSFGTFVETKAKQTLSIFHWVIEIQKSMFYLKHGFICLTLCAVNCCFRRVNIIGNFQLSLSIPTTGGLSRPKLWSCAPESAGSGTQQHQTGLYLFHSPFDMSNRGLSCRSLLNDV